LTGSAFRRFRSLGGTATGGAEAIPVGLLGGLVVATVLASAGVATALSEIGHELDLTGADSAWVMAAYSLGFAFATAVFGRLTDLRGAGVVLSAGTALLAIGSLLATAAWSYPVLLIGRLVQGCGGGAVPVLATSVIASVADPQQRRRSLGSFTAILTTASACGPLMGGAVADALGWRVLVLLPALSILLAMPLARRLLPAQPAPGRFDWPGALLVSMVTVGVLLGLELLAAGGGSSPAAAAGALVLVAAGLLGLARHLRRTADGFLPRPLVRDRSFMAGCGVGCALFATYFGLLFFVPLQLAVVHGWSPTRVGLTLLPAGILGALGSKFVGGSLALPRRLAPMMACCAAAGGALLAGGAPRSPWGLVLGLGIASASLGWGHVALVGAIPEQVPAQTRGIALGVFNLWFFLGGALGTVLVGGLLSRVSASVALAALASLPVAGAAASLAWAEGKRDGIAGA
jgi:MFS family permease